MIAPTVLYVTCVGFVGVDAHIDPLFRCYGTWVIFATTGGCGHPPLRGERIGMFPEIATGGNAALAMTGKDKEAGV